MSNYNMPTRRISHKLSNRIVTCAPPLWIVLSLTGFYFLSELWWRRSLYTTNSKIYCPLPVLQNAAVPKKVFSRVQGWSSLSAPLKTAICVSVSGRVGEKDLLSDKTGSHISERYLFPSHFRPFTSNIFNNRCAWQLGTFIVILASH